jgi:DNA-binding transcriptional ArsR family regulator
MEITQRHAELCSGLGDFHRILILYALANGELNVSELVNRIGLTQPTISHHLKILRACGVVSARRQGKAVYYMPADPRIIQAMDMLRAVLTDQIRSQGNSASLAQQRPSI